MTATDPTFAGLSDELRQQLESWLVAFDQTWDEGQLAGEIAKLPRDHPLRPVALAEMVRIDLERRWQRGRPARLEDYLRAYPELGTPQSVTLDLVAAEYQARQRAGEPPPFAEFAGRFPDRAEELRQRLEQAAPTSGQTAAWSTLAPGTATPTPAPCRPAPAGPALPERFGRYQIVRPLGRGGMGTVYLAHDTQLDREVALKVPRFSEDDGPDVVERFYREARAAAGLRHPNVCPVYDVGAIDGMPYLTMAYIDGRRLADLIADGPLPQDRAAALARQLALALDFTHRQGVIHRDLKPANILLTADGEPAITDFGLARRVNKPDARLTQSGALLGTPAYMAPEQAEGHGEAVGPAADVYSLGVILYELVTGQLPFRGSVASVLAQAVAAEPERPSSLRSDLSPQLEVIVMKAMAKKVKDRYGSMGELAGELGDYLEAGVRRTEPVNRITAALPKRAAVPKARRHKPSRWRRVVAAALAVGMFLLAAQIVLVIRDKNGEEKRIPLPDLTPGSTFRIETPDRQPFANGQVPDKVVGKETTAFNLPQALVIKGHTNEVHAVAISPDSKLLATGSEDKTIRLWDVASGERKDRIPHDTPIWCLAFSPDGKRLAAGDTGGRVTVWDVATGEKKSEFTADDKHGISLIGYSPDGKTLAVVPYDWHATQLWDLEQKKRRTILQGHTSWVAAVAFSADSATVGTSAADSTIRLWDARSGREKDSLRAHDGRIDCLAFLGNDQLVSGGHDGTVIVWDVGGAKKGNVIKPVLEAPQADRDCRKMIRVFVTPAGRIVSVTAHWDVDIWEPGQAKPLYHRKGEGGPGTWYYHERTALSPDGKTLVGSFGSNVSVYDVSPYTAAAK